MGGAACGACLESWGMPAPWARPGAQLQREERGAWATHGFVVSRQCREGWLKDRLLWGGLGPTCLGFDLFLGRVQSCSRLDLPRAQGHSQGGDSSLFRGGGKEMENQALCLLSFPALTSPWPCFWLPPPGSHLGCSHSPLLLCQPFW